MKKKYLRPCFFLGLILIFLLMDSMTLAQEKEKSQVKISWEEFSKLLKLDTDEISLTWEEFGQLVAQTGEEIKVSYALRNGKVILPREQFKQLLDRMKPPRFIIANPPADYVISKAEYLGLASKKGTEFTVTFTLEIFDNGEQKYIQIPFLRQLVGLEQVLWDNKPALVTENGGWYYVTTADIGHHQIKARFFISSDLEKGPRVLNLYVVKTAITLFELTIPLEKVDVSIPEAKELQISSRDGRTQIKAVLPATNAIAVDVHRKYEPSKETIKESPAKIYAETFNLLSIEDDAIRVNSKIKLNVLQNRIDHIQARIPQGFNILYIQQNDGSQLRDWQVNKMEQGSMVNISFNNSIEGIYILNILTEFLFKDQKADIQFNGFEILNAVRETGFVGAEKKSTAEANPSRIDKLDRIDIKDLPYELVGMSERPLLFGFRYLRHPYNLAMTINRHEELPTISTVIDMISCIAVVLEDGKMLTKVNYVIRNTWKQFLRLDLPLESEVWTVYVDGKRENASRGTDGKIMIPLARSKSENDVLKSFTVDLIYFSKGKKLGAWGKNTIQFPTADILISKMLWSVYLPQDYRYLHFSGNIEKEEMARTLNLILGHRRDFSIDQVSSYTNVADNLEREPQQQQEMDKIQQALPSNFKNKAIGQKDIAQQMRQEANLNLEFQTEQQKGLGMPGSGGNIFKIELPTSGQIYRFNKTVIEGESINLSYFYSSSTLLTIFKVFIGLVLLFLLYRLRKKWWGLGKKMYHWLVSREKIWHFCASPVGLRTILIFSTLVFYFISHVIFVVLVLLIITAIFRPDWLLRDRISRENKDEKNT